MIRRRHFSNLSPDNDLRLSDLLNKLDELVSLHDRIFLISDTSTLADAKADLIRKQDPIIAALSPLLERLSAAGLFYMSYDPDSGSADYHRQLSFYSTYGYEIVSGFKIVGTALDSISSPPPPLDSAIPYDEGDST